MSCVIARLSSAIRALGLKKGKKTHVLDACGGTGGDAILLAAYGAQVTCCERHPVVAEFLRHTLAAMKMREEHAHIAENILLHCADAATISDFDAFDAVHIDAMFLKKSSAVAHKDMRILQFLTESDEDSPDDLIAFFAANARRTAVKRAAKARTILRPNHVIAGKAIRYDVYTA